MNVAADRSFGDRIDHAIFWTFCLAFAVLPAAVTSLTADAFVVPKTTLIYFTVLTLLALEAARIFLTGRLRLPGGPAVLAALALVLLVGIATYFSVHRELSLIGLRKRHFGFSTYAASLIIFLSAASIPWDYPRLRALCRAAVSGAGIAAFIGLLQVLGLAWPKDFSGFFGRAAYSTFGNPNLFGDFLATVFPLALAVTAIERGGGKAAAILAAAFLAGGVIASGSSGALFGLLAAAAAWLLMTRPGPLQRTNLLASGLLLLILGTMMLSVAGLRGEQESWRRRAVIWRGAWRLAANNPLTGTGPETIRFTITDHLPIRLPSELLEDGHNIFLTTAAAAGFPAAAAFLVLLGPALSAGISAARIGGPAGLLLKGLTASLVGYIATNMLNPDHIVPMALAWLTMGILSDRRWAGRDYALPPTARPALTAVLALAVLLGGFFGWRAFAAEVHLARAEKSRVPAEMFFEYAEAERLNPYYDWYSIRIADRLTPVISAGYTDLLPEALSAADRAISKMPLESDNYVIKAGLYLEAAKHDRDPEKQRAAAKLFARALRLNAHNLNARRGLAEAELR